MWVGFRGVAKAEGQLAYRGMPCRAAEGEVLVAVSWRNRITRSYKRTVVLWLPAARSIDERDNLKGCGRYSAERLLEYRWLAMAASAWVFGNRKEASQFDSLEPVSRLHVPFAVGRCVGVASCNFPAT